MVKVTGSSEDFEKNSKWYLDNNELSGLFYDLNKPLHKLTVESASSEPHALETGTALNYLASTAVIDGKVSDGDYTLANDTADVPRGLTITVTSSTISAGEVILTAIDKNGNTQTYTLDLSSVLILDITDELTSIVDLEVKDLAGVDPADRIKIDANDAGITGIMSISNVAGILNSTGHVLGHFNSAIDYDSSLTVNTTALTTQAPLRKTNTVTDILNKLLPGEFSVDFPNGRIFYKKIDASATADLDYKFWITRVDTEIDVEADNVTINNIKTFATDLTDPLTTKYGLVNAFGHQYHIITDGTNEAVIKTGNTFAITDLAMGVADANVLAELVTLNTVDFATETTLGDIKTNTAIPTTITGGTKTVTTAGVAESLGASTTIKSIYIRATSTNTGNIYVGGSGVSSANGIALAANDSVEIDIADLATVYIDSDINGEGVGFTYFN